MDARRATISCDIDFEKQQLDKRRRIGNCKFIGILVTMGVVTHRVIILCSRQLLHHASEDSLEALCSLLSQVGSFFESEIIPSQEEKLRKMSSSNGGKSTSKYSQAKMFWADTIDELTKISDGKTILTASSFLNDSSSIFGISVNIFTRLSGSSFPQALFALCCSLFILTKNSPLL